MDYGGVDRRKTKKDLRRKRLARGYKRGGQFRTHNVSEVDETESDDKSVKKKSKGKSKSRKY